MEYKNQADTDALAEYIPHILEVLYMANTDARRYGAGVVGLDQRTGLFVAYEADQWYPIIKDGYLIGDVFVEYTKQDYELDKIEQSDPYQHQGFKITKNDYTANVQTVSYHKAGGGQIGQLQGSAETYPISGRQAAPLFHGYVKTQQYGTSVFDDIAPIIVDMVRIKRKLSHAISKNARPHLVAPAGLLVENEQGKIDIQSRGMLLPVNPDDPEPKYLQWDTNFEAARYQIDEHWRMYHTITGIPSILFSTSTGGAVSGESLKRLMIPFLSNLAKSKQDNITLVKMMLTMKANWLLRNGMPQMPQEYPEIDFPYDEIFIDEVERMNQNSQPGVEV